MKRTKILLWGVVSALAALASACGPATVRPASYSDPTVPCPGGQKRWSLVILDQRAERDGAEKVVAAIRNGIQSSFTGCQWSATPEPGVGTITIEIHRFASHLEDGSWQAAAEWTVRATNGGGRTLTEFEADEEASRINYQRYDGEKESLTEAFQNSLQRTTKGLRVLPAIGVLRPRKGTAPVALDLGAGAA